MFVCLNPFNSVCWSAILFVVNIMFNQYNTGCISCSYINYAILLGITVSVYNLMRIAQRLSRGQIFHLLDKFGLLRKAFYVIYLGILMIMVAPQGRGG
jgi:hypothetical protein